jgi:hypothetical protein
MPVIDESDEHGGLARAALALTTAIASEVRKGVISLHCRCPRQYAEPLSIALTVDDNQTLW